MIISSYNFVSIDAYHMVYIVVLDLDKTLIHAVKNNQRHCYGDFEIKVNSDVYSVYKRPYLTKFLDFCDEHFDHVIIWSLGIKEYVDKIVSRLFEHRKPPLCVLSRNCCYIEDNRWWKDTYTIKYVLDAYRIDYDDCSMVFIDDMVSRIKATHNVAIMEIKEFDTKMKRIVKRKTILRKRKRSEYNDEELGRMIKRIKRE